MTADILPLARKPAYTPMGPPVQCMTPGHGDITRYPARPRPGGQLCEVCLPIAPDGRDNHHLGDPR